MLDKEMIEASLLERETQNHNQYSIPITKQFDIDIQKYVNARPNATNPYPIIDPHNMGDTRIRWTTHAYLGLLCEKYGMGRVRDAIQLMINTGDNNATSN